jgi:hypothetical protein
MSPVIEKNADIARTAGRPLVINGKLYRLGQDCIPTYGNQVHAFEVTDISPTTYSEKMVENPLVKATGAGWNSDAMHHIDAFQNGKKSWIAVVDAQGK